MVARKSRAVRYRPAALVMALGLATLGSGHLGPAVRAQAPRPEAVKSLRLYVFDLGNIPVDKGNMFDPPIEVAAGGCCVIVGHLIVHPKGTLIWIREWFRMRSSARKRRAPSDTRESRSAPSSQRSVIARRTSPISDSRTITSTTRQMRTCSRNPRGLCRSPSATRCLRGNSFRAGLNPIPATIARSRRARRLCSRTWTSTDIFGDGTVVIKAAPGHTAGQQVLILNLPKTGRVMLSGDLYHFREERTQQVLPATLEFDKEQSRASRVMIEAYMKKNNIPLWIEHDTRLYATMKKAPNYIE